MNAEPPAPDWNRLRARLAVQAPAVPPAEAVAAPVLSDEARGLLDRPLVPAAVLVPILPGAGGVGVVLTKRTSHLSKHAGQVAFPGGRIDPGDADPEAAALRETEEEIGIPPSRVEVLGRLPDYVTGTGYRVSPVLAMLQPGQAFHPNPDEVEAVFTLPLSVLLDPDAPQRRQTTLRGRQREFWVWPHTEHYIWGATAAILVHLAHRLRVDDTLAQVL